VFTLSLTGQTTGQNYGPFTAVSNQDGSYNVTFQFTKFQAYTLNVNLGANDILASPVTNVNVFAGNVEAYYSNLVSKQSTFTAGQTQTWNI
jgi:hypothetical protein